MWFLSQEPLEKPFIDRLNLRHRLLSNSKSARQYPTYNLGRGELQLIKGIQYGFTHLIYIPT